MKGLRRVKLALGVLLVLLFGAVSFSHASTEEALKKYLQANPQSTSSGLVLKTPEEINDFLNKYYAELTPDERDLLQKALVVREAQKGRGKFSDLHPTLQAEIISQALESINAVFWPTYDQATNTVRPGVLGTLANFNDKILAAPQPVTPKQMLASLNPSRSAFAQPGISFSDLGKGTDILSGFHSVITSYWAACRNISYAILTVVLIVFGFMIMLRQNIEPRVVMTISNALPRIATALVLITFSFAISGLVIDVGRIFDGLIKTTFTDGSYPPFSNQATNHNIFTLIYSFVENGFTNIGASLQSPEYVWKFPEKWMDEKFPDWRCDYHPTCTFPTGQNGCKKADGQDCEKFYCSLTPFGAGGMKNYGCRIGVPKFHIPLPGGPGLDIHLYVDLIDPNDVPVGCGKRTVIDDDTTGLPSDDPGVIAASPPCCNQTAPKKCHGDKESWKAPFPRSSINILEMFLNRLIVFIIGALINFLFLMTLFSVVISLLFKMLSCFALWFVYTIVSPFVFMWGAIPGQEDTIEGWVKNFAANVLAFPAVNFMINLALAIAKRYKADPGVVPPAPGGGYPSFLYIGPEGAVGMLVAFGIILITPAVPDLIKDIIGVKGKGPTLPDITKPLRKIPILGSLAG